MSTLVVIVFSSVIAFCLWRFLRRKAIERHDANYPPVCNGWIPWLGCAVEFGKAPLLQIEAKRKQLGPLFTLYVAGKRLTFLTEPEDFHHFFQSPNVDFQEAVVDAVNHAAGIPKDAFYRNHTKLHDTVKGRLSSQSLDEQAESLCKEFNEILHAQDNLFIGDLAGLIRRLMYKSVINTLFGRGVLSDNECEFDKLVLHFVKFDEQFEYGSQLPEFFLRDWASSKHWFLKKFKSAVMKAEKEKSDKTPTLLQSILEIVDKAESHSFGLLLFWATLANAIPITFWTLVSMTANCDSMEKAKVEIRKVFGEFEDGKYIPFSEDTCKKLPFVRCCVLEAIRLYSPGVITRKVIQTFKIKGYTIPSGDMLMVSPYWAHRNVKYFPSPNKFEPERWKDVDVDKRNFLEGFIGFGNGRYQCPGRWFALLEIQMFVSLFLWKYDVKILNGVPTESHLHIVGTQQPKDLCEVELSVST